MAADPKRIADLRTRLDGIVDAARAKNGVLPFGVAEIDRRLPRGGLALGALHEIAGGANGAVSGAAAASFAAGLAARTGGKVLWCFTQPDLYTPALVKSGLGEDQAVFFEAKDEAAILDCFEEALRHGGLTAVVGELAGLSRVASQRLQMAAETTGTLAIAIRRWRRQVDAKDFGNPTAAYTRWRVTEVPAARLPVRGTGRPRWLLELMRCRGGDCADFEVEASDAKGFVAIPSELADGSAGTEVGRFRAAN